MAATKRPPVRTAPWLALTGIGIALATVFFLVWPEIDLTVAWMFYGGAETPWLSPGRYHVVIDDYIRPGLRLVAIAFVIYTLWRVLSHHASQRGGVVALLFAVLALAIGPGLIVNGILKEYSGRARPRNIEEFGGDKLFTDVLHLSDQCESNCSFVSGDVSAVTALLAFALIAPRGRRMWIAAALVAGAASIWARVAMGAHFLSDSIFAFLFTIGITLTLYRWMVEQRFRADLAPLGSAVSPLVDVLAMVPARIARAMGASRMAVARAGVRLRRARRALAVLAGGPQLSASRISRRSRMMK